MMKRKTVATVILGSIILVSSTVYAGTSAQESTAIANARTCLTPHESPHFACSR